MSRKGTDHWKLTSTYCVSHTLSLFEEKKKNLLFSGEIRVAVKINLFIKEWKKDALCLPKVLSGKDENHGKLLQQILQII